MAGSLLIKIVAGIALLYLGIRWFEWSRAFKPKRRMDPEPESGYPEKEEITFCAEDGCRLKGWWFKNEQARGTVLFCHGNAGNMSTRWDVYKGLYDLGLNVFTFDYRGYGKSKGFASEKGIYRDVLAAYEVIRAEYDDSEQPPLLVYGASLGGAPAVYLASKKPVLGLIIEGGFTSSYDIGEAWYPGLPIKHILTYGFNSEDIISKLDMPKLIAHSNIDKVIPYDLGKKLFDAAAEPKKFFVLKGEHGEAGWLDTPEFYQELEQFVDTVFSN